MEIQKSGEASSEGQAWWRTRDTRATCHNRVTVSCERHPLKSPRFSRSSWYKKHNKSKLHINTMKLCHIHILHTRKIIIISQKIFRKFHLHLIFEESPLKLAVTKVKHDGADGLKSRKIFRRNFQDVTFWSNEFHSQIRKNLINFSIEIIIYNF